MSTSSPPTAKRPAAWLQAAGRKTGDNLLSHPSVGALPLAVCRLNERVRDGYVCFPAPILTRGLIPEPDVRLSLTHPELAEKVSIHRLASSR